MTKRTSIEELAALEGLHAATWSPGDGLTRYRFQTEDWGYNASDGLFTALGRREAIVFLRGVRAGKALSTGAE